MVREKKTKPKSSVPTFSGAPPSRDTRKSRSSSSSSSSDRNIKPNRRVAANFRDSWISVQALGATQLHGWKRREWEADAFEALGGKKQVREHKMPNRMRMGIMAKRKQREERNKEKAKKADLVTGNGDVKRKKKGGGQRDRDKKRKKMERGGGEQADPLANRGVNFRNGVLRVSNPFGKNGTNGTSGKKKRRR